jgi:Winged helix-turn helix
VTTRAGRAMLGAILGSCRAGEQTLLRRLARRRPELFAGRVTCFDRNFPGHGLITAILDAGGHVAARVSATLALPLACGYADQCWTLARVADRCWRRSGVEYTLAGMDVLLHRTGWSVQIPARRATERDEEKIAGWREDTWPVIKGRRRT